MLQEETTPNEIDKDQLWQVVLGELELMISRANFKTWFRNTHISQIEDNGKTVIVSVPNNFAKSWLEGKYYKYIMNALQNATDDKVEKVVYKVAPIISSKINHPQIVKLDELIKNKKNKLSNHGLNPKYTFENFVAGSGNELAYAASMAVSRSPGKKYNPLFIYGGVGLGKTHLLQAISHAILKKNPRAKVLYTNAETFTTNFVKAIRQKTLEKFKKIYRNLDVLLIDDIQFMAGKERTQEEFFYTFNTLYQKQSQIVITSDRQPQAIPALEDRMVSRFKWGLTADIKPPDIETRMAILQEKCKEKGYNLSKEILQYLAAHIQNNVRELEGALNKLIAYYELHRVPLTVDMVKNILESFTSTRKKGLVSSKDLIDTVADFYNLKTSDMISSSRKKELVIARQATIYLLREELGFSFPLIGKEMGGRDHTTVMHAYQKVKEEIGEEGRFKQKIDLIRERLYNK